MSSADRSAVLKLLGIDVWRLRQVRAAADSAQSATSLQAQSRQPDPVPDSRPSGGLAVDQIRGGEVPEAVRGLRQALAGADRADQRVANDAPGRAARVQPDDTASVPAPGETSPAADEARFTVLSLATDTRLLLLECHHPADVRRLGADILASCASGRPARTREMLFEWTADSERGGKLSAPRALAAFSAKQIDDVGGDAIVLVCERVAARLPELCEQLDTPRGRLVRIPAADALLGDAGSKKRLWLDLQVRMDLRKSL